MPIPEWFNNASAFKLVGLDENDEPIEGSFKEGGFNLNIKSTDLPIPHQEELPAHGVLGTGEDTVIYTSPAGIQEYDCFTFQQTVALAQVDIRVKATAEDTAFSDPVRFLDLMAADPQGTRILVTNAGLVGRYALLGKFYQIQISQSGATGANIEGTHSVTGGGI